MPLGTNGSAGTLAASTTPATVAIVVASIRGTIRIKAAAANAANVLVNVGGVHQADDFAVLEPGDLTYYRVIAASTTLTYKSASGTPSLHVDACAAGPT